MNEEESISNGAAEAADALTEIIEPFEKLRNALIRLRETKIVGSDEQVEILQRQGAPTLHRIAREMRADRRLKKLRSLAANCRPQLHEMYEAVIVMEKALRG